LSDVKVIWQRLAAGNVMNDALLSGTLHIASGGIPPLITLWDRTRGEVKAIAALNAMPNILSTRNPNVKSVRDFTDKDRIALPAAKVSFQAMLLQMAAVREWGEAEFARLDTFTVSMSHPDGMIALISGRSEITAHFTAPPYSTQELERPGIHKVLSSYEVLGGPATFVIGWTTSRFVAVNPRTYAAFVAALEEAIDFINSDRRAAAELYLKVSKSKESMESVLKMLDDPDIRFTLTPNGIIKMAEFMHKIGSIRNRPGSWKDLFFSNVHHLPGS
jgi:NitT/TauT family transport system substrate-binding protein